MSDIIKSIVSVLISCVKDTSRYTLACGGVDSMIAWYGKKIGAQSAIHAFDVGLAKAAKYVGNPVAFVHAKSGFGGVVQLSACGTFYKRNDIGLGLRIAKDANEAESFKGKDVYGLVSTLTDVLKLKAYPLPINANGEYHGVVYTVRYGNAISLFQCVPIICGSHQDLMITLDARCKNGYGVLDMQSGRKTILNRHATLGRDSETDSKLTFKMLAAKPAKKARKTVRKVKA